MAKILALYNKPVDPAAFDRYYFSTHIPIARKIPGLRRYEISTGPVLTPQGESPYHLAAVLSFDSMATIREALASAEGQATANDLANFAEAGVDLLMFDSRDVSFLSGSS
jgi:uncharacterized protein (TIGR02118 family)